MAMKKLKQLNYGYLIEQEGKIEKITLETYKKPLESLDKAIKFFLDTLDLSLKIHEAKEIKDKELRNYCKFYLTVGNVLIHLLRTSRKALLQGYYGSIAVIMRTIINYLNMSIYIHHHPGDVSLLLKENQTDFFKNKVYKKKFHEFNIKRELHRLGYTIPDQENTFAKVTHGSVWAAQVFGWKGLDMVSDYDLNYSPKFSLTQSSTYLSFLLSIPTDFARYFIIHIGNKRISGFNALKKDFIITENEIVSMLRVLESSYKFTKNAPEEIQNAILKKIGNRKNSTVK